MKRTSAAPDIDPEKLVRGFCPPMLAVLVDGIPPDETNWVYELKYDGFRAIAASSVGRVAVISRNGIDLADRFPTVAASVSRLRGHQAVLDGEIVAVGKDGVPRFELLQRGQGTRTSYIVFDLLWLDGVDLREQPIEKRRELLEKLLRRPPEGIELAGRIESPARAALEAVARLGWEGLIAKRRESRYESKRSKAWLKLKAIRAQELAIVGFTPASHS
ncbi:MAG TPA: DNA ligase, partial [Thermoanaerobaculia bacterium]|nr:DNA ligase [Thermoanaerobaculia bacterium]